MSVIHLFFQDVDDLKMTHLSTMKSPVTSDVAVILF